MPRVFHDAEVVVTRVMTRRLFLHVGSTVLAATSLVFGCIAALTFLFAFLDEAQAVGEELSLLEAAWIALTAMPRKLQDVILPTVFIGTAIGIGNLALASELTVYRSAGVSIWRLFAAAAIPGALVIGVSMMTHELLADAEAQAQGKYESTSKGTWLREGRTITNVRSLNADGTIANVVQFEIQGDELTTTRRAAWAEHQPDAQSWWLHESKETHFEWKTTATRIVAQQPWATAHTPSSMSALVSLEPRKMGLVALWRQMVSLRNEQGSALPYRVEFWLSVTQPLVSLGMVLFATALLVGNAREMGMGACVTIAFGVSLLFHYLQTMLAPLTVVYGLPPLGVSLVPVLVAWTAGYLVVRRAH